LMLTDTCWTSPFRDERAKLLAFVGEQFASSRVP
jgi:hypothetical protein